MNKNSTGHRTKETLHRHYLVERELADRLRAASAEERKGLYRTVYNELFLRLPDHGQNARKSDAALQQARVSRQMNLLRQFLRTDTVFLEVGAGDCQLASCIAEQVRKVYAVDVSEVIAGSCPRPSNLELVISDGITIPCPPETVQVAYSHMLLEHLHPEDSVLQMREIYRALAPKGIYICVTQHSISGPHDVSKHFDAKATGFHLKEYTYQELAALFRQVGFASPQIWMRVKGRVFRVPRVGVISLEAILRVVPRWLARKLTLCLPLRLLFGDAIIVAEKPG